MIVYLQYIVFSVISLLITLNHIVASESVSDATYPKVSELTKSRSIPLSIVNNNDDHSSASASASNINNDNDQPILFTRQYEKLMVQALINIQSKDCQSDLNATIKGIQMQQPWAIASMIFLFSFFCLTQNYYKF